MFDVSFQGDLAWGFSQERNGGNAGKSKLVVTAVLEKGDFEVTKCFTGLLWRTGHFWLLPGVKVPTAGDTCMVLPHSAPPPEPVF